MAVIDINTPNLSNELNDIESFKVVINDNIQTSFDTLINPCFKLKPTQDCKTLVLKDYTDYQELGNIDINDVSINISYGLKTDCGCNVICENVDFNPNGQFILEKLDSDGVYGFYINISYSRDENGSLVFYTKTVQQSYTKDCCTSEYEYVGKNIWGNMSDISCSIISLNKIGRNVKSLNKSYRKLSNLLWLYYNSTDSCSEKEKVKCLYTKIK